MGAEADRVAALAPAGTQVARNPAYRSGMGGSLRTGLLHLATALDPADAALVLLVDLPGVDRAVVRRVAAAATGPDVLARAVYGGRPGHPVLLGRDHWTGVCAVATGDRGARDYLRDRPVRAVECGDLGHGEDVDVPAAD
ncbi:hypothetical protein GCM10011594_05800 [Nakamurella endophytica]|uniref:MobA-like NTP transferase domain-containing protein n=1 Tax=Nakamurella endophytica TaxID=1748367 RepID=A0A917SM64_9ACTN|nr:hypothetical protein GCM10011594_05800 [Nakamurella endophytica]